MARLPEEQRSKIREVFRLYDENDSGTIKCRDVGKAMKSLGMAPTEHELKERLSKVHCDDSQTINFDQFLDMMSHSMSSDDDMEGLRELFRLADKDGDGYITAPEFSHAMAQIGERMTNEEIDALFKAADHDLDGKITLEELRRTVAGDN